MNFSPKIVIPYASIISLYLYFLTYDMVLNPSFKVGRDFVFFLLVSIHTGFVLFEKQKKSNYFEGHLSIGISTIISFLSFVLRSYLDVPTRAGVSLEASPIPKIRDFLLIPIVVCALFSLVYQIFITLSKESIAAQDSNGFFVQYDPKLGTQVTIPRQKKEVIMLKTEGQETSSVMETGEQITERATK